MKSKSQCDRVLFVDDDPFSARAYIEALVDGGFSVTLVGTARKALEKASQEQFSAVVLDVQMSPGGHYTAMETACGLLTGIALAKDLKDMLPGSPVVALTASTAAEVEEYFSADPLSRYFHKSGTSPEQLCRNLKHLLRYEVQPKVFMVHGRDHTTLNEVRKFLRERLDFQNLIILAEERSSGNTIIEKLEMCSDESDLIFVLLTPDDLVSDTSAPLTARARQNVILECGYFLGKLGRRNGKVILLKKGNIELPSDLSGIVYIDITDGIEKAEKSIRKEAAEWL